MIRSTFYGFTTAISGMKASQTALDVIGQNVSNANTDGYTRQRVVQNSVVTNTTAEKYGSASNNLAGQGVSISSLGQIRDVTLDAKFRTENASVGKYDAEVSAMSHIATVFDEAATDGLRDSILSVQEAFQNQSLNPDRIEYDSLTRASVSSMTTLMNQYAKQLDDAYEQELYDFENGSVADVNGILKNIAIMDQSILKSEVAGDNPLELYDQRNELLDQLSSYCDIDYYYEKKQLAPNIITNTLHVSMKTQSGQKIEMINGVYFAQMGVSTSSGEKGDDASTHVDDKVSLFVSGLTDDTTATYDTLLLFENQKNAAEKIAARDELATMLNADITSGPATIVRDGKPVAVKKDDTKGAYYNTTYADGSPAKMYIDKDGNDLGTEDDFAKYEDYIKSTGIATEAKYNSMTDITPLYGLDANGVKAENGNAITNGILFGTLNVLNAAGDYEEGGCAIRGYKYYMNALDTLASEMTSQFNELNKSPNYTTDGQQLNEVTNKETGLELKTGAGDKVYAIYNDTTKAYEYGTISKTTGDNNYKFTEVKLADLGITDDKLNKEPWLTENNLLTGDVKDVYQDPVPMLTNETPPREIYAVGTYDAAGNFTPVKDDSGPCDVYAAIGDNGELEYFVINAATKVENGISNYYDIDRAYKYKDVPAGGANHKFLDTTDVPMTVSELAAKGYAFELQQVTTPTTEKQNVVRASNIHVTDEWLQGNVHVVNTTQYAFEGDNKDAANDNLLKFVNVFEKDTAFTTKKDKDDPMNITIFTGGFEDYLSAIGDTVALDVNTKNVTLDSYTAVLNSIDGDRMSVSGVSLDEEAVDIYKFQRAYQAASRVMTTLDEMLDKLINGTGTVGR